MHFASSIPWWLALLTAAGLVALAVAAYYRPLVPLTRAQRVLLTTLRALTLLTVLFFVCRPVLLLPPSASGDVIVPVLVDISRSMGIEDADGASRLARAIAVVKNTLLPTMTKQATVEILAFGEHVAPASLDSLTTDARATALNAALEAVRTRYRGRRVPGIVLVSDGADTAGTHSTDAASSGAPVFAIGVGSADGLPDREVTGITAGDPRLDQASIDLHVSIAAHGFGRTPFQLRVLANGQVVDTRRVVPATDGAPIDESVSVSPDPLHANVYTADIPAEPGEAVVENNTRSLVVNPAGRKRRVLLLAGAPGYEHTFLIRALQQDPGLDVDSVIRKGKNDQNVETFLVQAGGGRAEGLTSGFPLTREALFGYDALVIANIESDFFSRAQLEMAADFVGKRGGGLLVLGGRSFERRGLIGTPLETVLPVELSDRRGAAVHAEGEEGQGGHDRIALTEEGARHPVMRIGGPNDDLRALWATLPPLASNAAIGGPRPGASVLAVTSSSNGVALPVVAVQRYGRGRSMVFAGEASWRWRMMQPAADRRYDFFWRQAARWLSTDAPDPVTLTVSPDAAPGDLLSVGIDVRDGAFEPIADATVDATLTSPGGKTETLTAHPGDRGRFAAATSVETAGLYRVQVDARRNGASLGAADRWVYVGGSEREFADPRLNAALLRRLARESGGQYADASDAARLVSDLAKAIPQNAEPERRDLWHEPWAFVLVLLLLSAEWLLRRRWGLR